MVGRNQANYRKLVARKSRASRNDWSKIKFAKVGLIFINRENKKRATRLT